MYGLSVRWSLPDSPDVPERLRRYVVTVSLGRFSGMAGLSQKTWRMRPGEWFEGLYLFADAASRDAFRVSFEASAATSPVTEIVGSLPVLVEDFEVVALADGPEPLVVGAGPGAAVAGAGA